MVLAGSKKFRLPIQKKSLPAPYVSSLAYHDLFDYPMTIQELKRWKCTKRIVRPNSQKARKIGKYYLLTGRSEIVSKREARQKVSLKKVEIAKKAARILGILPSVKIIAITGALAMMNADPNSDIDLLIVCASGTLWTTRLTTVAILDLLGIPRRRYGQKTQKDRLCLNMWLDEKVLSWDKADRNIYTAHEIAQVVPLANKDKTHEKFLYKNRWIKDYWPRAAKILREKDIKILSAKSKNHSISQYLDVFMSLFESIAYWLQYLYMKPKITREVVSPTRAIFHPIDWGKIVLTRLK